MSSDLAFEIPVGKYNKWCERRPLVCAEEKRVSRANAYLVRSDLTQSEKAAFYLYELVGCEGLEFVAFSNARLNETIVLPGHIKLVPCFLPENGGSLHDPLTRLTMKMTQRSRFIYDGWLSISDWRIETVREMIRKVDAALSVFALRGRVWFSWEPKYIPIDQSQPSFYNFERVHIEEVNQLSHFIDSLSDADARALLRSVAWLSQSRQLTESAARFLFSILAIESLATYIEKESTHDSIFSSLRSTHLTKPQHKAQREGCIKEVMNRLYDIDPEGAIRSAYLNCGVGIKRQLRVHLEAVFRDDPEPVDLLFNTKVEGKTSYDLRSDIAHGRVDALSEAQREGIHVRVWDIERTARKYILKVIELIRGKPLFVEKMTASIFVPVWNAVLSSEQMYKGPIHMAEIYMDYL